MLDTYDILSHISMKRYSISGAARLLGVHRATLHRWIGEGVIPEPIAEDIDGARLRYWKADGLAKVKEYKATHYQKKPRKKTGKLKKSQ